MKAGSALDWPKLASTCSVSSETAYSAAISRELMEQHWPSLYDGRWAASRRDAGNQMVSSRSR